MKKIPLHSILFILLLFLNLSLQAQDSLTVSKDIYSHKEKKWYKPFIIPAALIGVGAYISLDDHIISKYDVRDFRNEQFEGFHSGADDFLQFAPFVIAGVLELTEQNNFSIIKKRAIHLIKTEAILAVLTYSIKTLADVKRPDSGGHNSFPSGHTAQAFAAASFIYREYCNDHSKWIGAGGFVIATSVGVLRVLNDRHWISDVIAGAGIGMLSAELGCMDWSKKNNNTSSMLLPFYSKEIIGVAFLKTF